MRISCSLAQLAAPLWTRRGRRAEGKEAQEAKEVKEAQEAKEVKESREGKEGMEVKVAQETVGGQRLFPLVGQGLPV